MNLLEWQAKRLLSQEGLPSPRGSVARTAAEAAQAATELGRAVMVKAQIPRGGRGKAGGVLLAADPQQAASSAEQLLDRELLGCRVHSVLVEEVIEPARELYLSVAIDYEAKRPVLMAGGEGGVDVESASKLGRVELNPLLGLRDYQVWQAMTAGGIPSEARQAVLRASRALHGAFRRHQATLVEVNPLMLLTDGSVLAADARIVLDEAVNLPDDVLESGEDVTDRIKRACGFDYVELDPNGNIGLISTGAGGTMLVLDMIVRAGGRPINFADVRTGMIGRDPARLVAVLEELSGKPNLKAILVSVFGAITDLEVLAGTLLEALRLSPPQAAVHVRFQGRNEEPARRVLRSAGIRCHERLDEAIAAVVATAA